MRIRSKGYCLNSFAMAIVGRSCNKGEGAGICTITTLMQLISNFGVPRESCDLPSSFTDRIPTNIKGTPSTLAAYSQLLGASISHEIR